MSRIYHGMSKTAEYKIWKDIKKRCFNERSWAFRYYGGRGIAMATEWRDNFAAFFAHIGPRPSIKHTVERLENSRGYEPGNVKWATRAEQNRNTRRTHFLTLNGQTMCIEDWAKQTGIDGKNIHSRLSRGWTVEDALTITTLPVGQNRMPKCA